MKRFVGVIGTGASDPQAEEIAEQIGMLLAKQEVTVVCGGLGGVMKAACRGAKSAGGITVGILPGDGRSDANKYVDFAIPTGLGEARNALVVRASDGLIAVSGGYGTLSEIGLALKAGKPIVGVGTWRAQINDEPARIEHIDDPVAAVERILSLVP